MGMPDAMCLWCASASSLVMPGTSQMGVAMAPGAMAFTRTPSWASSSAHTRVKFSTAALAPWYMERFGERCVVPTDDMLMMLPLEAMIIGSVWMVMSTSARTSRSKALS